MSVLLLIIVIGVELLQLAELRFICRLLSQPKEKTQTPPPKARQSFVVKRMEEKLKEAMYPSK